MLLIFAFSIATASTLGACSLTLLCLALALAPMATTQEVGPSFLAKWNTAKTDPGLKKTAQKDIRLVWVEFQGHKRYGITNPDHMWSVEMQAMSAKGAVEKPAYLLGGKNYDPTAQIPQALFLKSLDGKGVVNIRIRVINQESWDLKRTEFLIPISKAGKMPGT